MLRILQHYLLKMRKKSLQTLIKSLKSENRLQEVRKPTSRSQKIELQEVGKTEFKKSEKPTSVGRENRLQEVGKTDSNYTNKNYINVNYIDPINQSEIAESK